MAITEREIQGLRDSNTELRDVYSQAKAQLGTVLEAIKDVASRAVSMEKDIKGTEINYAVLCEQNKKREEDVNRLGKKVEDARREHSGQITEVQKEMASIKLAVDGALSKTITRMWVVFGVFLTVVIIVLTVAGVYNTKREIILKPGVGDVKITP